MYEKILLETKNIKIKYTNIQIIKIIKKYKKIIKIIVIVNLE